MKKAKTTTPEVTETVVIESAKRGRPVIDGSVRQVKLAAQAAKVAAGGSISRGRPSNPTSARQARLAAQDARKASGLDIKVGRPKGSGKPKEVVIEAEVAEAVEA
jgi:hypothetical protein